MNDGADAANNKYVSLVAKKSRNLKKKLDKILQAEVQQKSGKELNTDQLSLLNSKKSVERSLQDMESLRIQLEEIASNEATEASDKMQEQVQVTTEVSTNTTAVDNTEGSTQCEVDVETRAIGDDVGGRDVSMDMDMSLVQFNQEQIYKLLKLLHVCARFKNCTGKELPADVDYFGQCLMGETSISGFRETLQQSARNAELYLDVEKGAAYEAIRGMSYNQVSDIIDNLAVELEGGAPVVEESVPEEPQINFFATAPTNNDTNRTSQPQAESQQDLDEIDVTSIAMSAALLDTPVPVEKKSLSDAPVASDVEVVVASGDKAVTKEKKKNAQRNKGEGKGDGEKDRGNSGGQTSGGKAQASGKANKNSRGPKANDTDKEKVRSAKPITTPPTTEGSSGNVKKTGTAGKATKSSSTSNSNNAAAAPAVVSDTDGGGPWSTTQKSREHMKPAQQKDASKGQAQGTKPSGRTQQDQSQNRGGAGTASDGKNNKVKSTSAGGNSGGAGRGKTGTGSKPASAST